MKTFIIHIYCIAFLIGSFLLFSLETFANLEPEREFSHIEFTTYSSEDNSIIYSDITDSNIISAKATHFEYDIPALKKRINQHIIKLL